MQLASTSVGGKRRGGDVGNGALIGLVAQSVQNKGFDMQGLNTANLAQAYANLFQENATQLPLLKAAVTGQTGGDSTGMIINIAANRAPTTPGAPAPVPTVSGQPVEEPAPVMTGGVLLKAPKKQIRVSLKAPKKQKGAAPATRKAPRKIRLGVRGINTRLNRARKATAHARSASLPVVKQRLVRAGVIKANSKAPEPMLRSM